LPKASDFLSP